MFNEQAHSAIPSSYTVQDVTPLRVHDPFIDYLSISTKTNDFDDSSLIKNGGKYKIPGHFTSMDLFYYKDSNNLNVRGSFPWYTNGHNLYSSIDELEKTILDISLIIDVDMTRASVQCFELSKVFTVDYPVSMYQMNHLNLTGFDRILYRGTLYYNKFTRRGKKNKVLKMYDASANARFKNMTVQPNAYWLKFEEKIYNPSRYFNQAITVMELIYDKAIIDKTYSEMHYYYDQIEKGIQVDLSELPSTDDLIMAALISQSRDPYKDFDRLLKTSKLDRRGKYKRRKLFRDKLKKVAVINSPFILSF